MRTSRSITLNDLSEHLTLAKERLSHEKRDILTHEKLDHNFNREEYAFAYMRAERVGMQAINRRLAEIAWLPMQLDPQSELVAENRTALKRWLTATIGAYPAATEFGNDFIHALTRTALHYGWDDPVIGKLSSRIANLFRDLSCLIGMIYYSTWLAEHQVEGIALSNPADLNRSVVEIAAIVQSPELHRALRTRAEEAKKRQAKKTIAKKEAKKDRPFLRLIRNENITDPSLMPDSVPV